MQWGQTAVEDLGDALGRLLNGLKFLASRPAEVVVNHPVFRPPYCTCRLWAAKPITCISRPSSALLHPPSLSQPPR